MKASSWFAPKTQERPASWGAVEDPFDAAARTLAGFAGRPAPKMDFTPLAARDIPGCVAVDGSHAVLADTGALWVVAIQAAALHWPGPRPQVRPQVRVVLADEARDAVAADYEARGAKAPRIGSAEAAAEAWRALAEVDAARTGLDAPLLLLDGAFEGVPEHASALWAPVLARANALGVSKRSAALHDGAPLLESLARTGPAGPWIAPLPHGTAAKLHPQARHVLRIDGPVDEIGALVPLARDVAYLGYPYPLAAVHNVVAITADEKARLRAGLERAARQHGAWSLLDDPHAMLDANV